MKKEQFTVRPWDASNPPDKKGVGYWEADIFLPRPVGAKGPKPRKRVRVPGKVSKTQAENWAQDERTRLLQRRDEPAPAPTTKAPTLAKFAPDYVAHGKARAKPDKPSTTAAKESIIEHHLEPAIGTKRLDTIGWREIAALKVTPQGQAAGPQDDQQRPDGPLRPPLKLAKRPRAISQACRRSPCKRSRMREATEMPRYSDAEYARLLGAARAFDGMYLAILLACQAGLRLGELIALRWTDVDLARGKIRIVLETSGSTRKGRPRVARPSGSLSVARWSTRSGQPPAACASSNMTAGSSTTRAGWGS